MSEISRILDQMDRAMAGEAWHGPALEQLLEGVNAEQASMHTVRGAHSIWEIVNHIAAWNRIVHQRIAGTAVNVTPEMDWPPVWEASEMEWRRSLDRLRESRAHLRTAVATVRDDELSTAPAGTEHSRYLTLHGLVQHDLYHAGQIAILKKALG
ncbi:MAG: DinB family protein [Candidatus Acidiferrales bacterium]